MSTSRGAPPPGVVEMLAATAMGLALLALTARHGFLALSWSDEIVYAVMGRNIAEGRGIVSSFYDTRDLLRAGYPLGDVHMPGHALFMSLFFRLLGSAEWVAFAPSWAAFVASGALVGGFAGRLHGGAAGTLAALYFFLMPGTVGYAHSSMAELTLVLASALFLLAWWECGTARRGVLMALALCAAVLCRETMLALLLLAAEALWRAGPRRRRTAAAFAGTFVLGLLMLIPLYLDRARFPHFLSQLPPFPTPAWRDATFGRVLANLAPPLPARGIEESLAAVTLLLGLALPVVVLLARRDAVERRLAGAVLALTAVVFTTLVALYPLRGWALVRVLLFLAPWFAVLLAGLVSSIGRSWLRWSVACLTLGLLGASALSGVGELARNRRAEWVRNSAMARLFAGVTSALPIQTAIVEENPWAIGWQRFPVTIVWSGPLEADSLRQLNRVLRIDAVFRRAPAVKALLRAAHAEGLGVPYAVVRCRPEASWQLLLRTDLDDPKGHVQAAVGSARDWACDR